jgi:hypothetical protein
VTLTFESAGDMTVTIPVDNERMPAAMMVPRAWQTATATTADRCDGGRPDRHLPPHASASSSSTQAGTATVAGPVRSPGRTARHRRRLEVDLQRFGPGLGGDVDEARRRVDLARGADGHEEIGRASAAAIRSMW